MKTERVWINGRPPHVGWWNASWCKGENNWRWWDGGKWSSCCGPEATPEQAGRAAQLRSVQPWEDGTKPIKWTYYWPENARVPRIDPRQETGHA